MITSISFGTPPQPLDLALSFTSNQTSVIFLSSDCLGFNQSDSSSYVVVPNSSVFSDVIFISSDPIALPCLVPLTSCESNQSIGSFGLNYYPNSVLFSIFSYLKSNLTQFTLNIYQNDTSQLVFGLSDLNISEPFVLQSSPNLTSWGITAQGYEFGSISEELEANILFDFSLPYIFAPRSVVSQIFSQISESNVCVISELKELLCACDTIADSPALVFNTPEQNLTISFLSLFEELEEQCRFVLTYNEDDSWVIGRNLFAEYAVTFDVSTKEMIFQAKPQEEEKPVMSLDEVFITIYTIAGCFGFYIAVRIVYLLYGWISSKFGTGSDEIQEPLVEDYDAIEIAKFRAKKSEGSVR